ncbi:MAG: malto-oligosyltrehalose trehalohydrolase [Candidatus Acidiferrales bacterium]
MTAQLEGPLGAVWSGEGLCRFLLWAPRAKRIDVHFVSPCDRTVPMQPLERGYFCAVVEDIVPGALYRYRLDGQNERPDPVSRFQPQGVHGPSQVVDTRFDWGDVQWPGLPLQEYVFYELHVGTFTPQGTFDAIIPRIADLKSLGITAIELMPVAQFPGSRNWGYDGVYPYAVQDSYGGPAALKRLVNECHQQELAVVLDVVYNHLGPEGNYLADYAPYFTDNYRTPWGEAINFDGPHSDEVRRYFIENTLQWIIEFHIDALRLDAIHAIVDPSARPFLEELGSACHAKAKQLNRQIYLIAESNRNDARVIKSCEVGGWGLDAVWNDDFHHSLHVLLTGEQNGYYEDFRGIEDLAQAFRNGFVYSGQYSKYRQKRHGNSSREIPAERFVVFAQNHDQVGNRMLGDRLAQQVSLEQLKLAAGIVLLSPYVPLLFMGEEYGEPAPFQYFISHGDPALIETVRNGRRDEFAKFNWAADPVDPEDDGTFLRSKLHWELRFEGHHHLLRNFHQELLALRRDVPALSRLDKDSMKVVAFLDEKVLFIQRWCAASRVVAAFHFDETQTQIALPVPAGRWQKRLDSMEQRWGGEGSQIPDALVSRGEVQVSSGHWAFVLFVQSEEIEK